MRWRLVLLVLAALTWQPGSARAWLGRDLGCVALSDARGRDICAVLEREMEWTWFGHAIVSPGWRVTLETIRRGWCVLRISPADVPALEALRQSGDFRLETGATAFLALLRPAEQETNSVYHPGHPAYLLRLGCAEAGRS